MRPIKIELPRTLLKELFIGDEKPLATWIVARTVAQTHPFERTVREIDLETITSFVNRIANAGPVAQRLPLSPCAIRR